MKHPLPATEHSKAPLWMITLQPGQRAKEEGASKLPDLRQTVHLGALVWWRPARPQCGEGGGPRALSRTLRNPAGVEQVRRADGSGGNEERQQRCHRHTAADEEAGRAAARRDDATWELHQKVAEKERREQLPLQRLVPSERALHPDHRNRQRSPLRLQDRAGHEAQPADHVPTAAAATPAAAARVQSVAIMLDDPVRSLRTCRRVLIRRELGVAPGGHAARRPRPPTSSRPVLLDVADFTSIPWQQLTATAAGHFDTVLHIQ